MRLVTARSLVLPSAAIAVLAGTGAANAQENPVIVVVSDASAPIDVDAGPPIDADAGAPIDSVAGPASPPPLAAAPSPPVESGVLPLAPLSGVPANIHIGARLRAAGRYYSEIGGPNASAIDSLYGELRASGTVYEHVTITLSLYATGANTPLGIEDAIIGFDFADPVHLWAGQMLVPADRTGLGGPFYSIPWNFYQGVLAYGAGTRVVAVPRGNSIGRDGGAVLWGDLAAKKLHYALGAFLPLPAPASPNAPLAQTPLLSGRLGIDILGHENGYVVKSSYFGDRDIVAIGVGGQYQKDGSLGVAPTNAAGVPTGPGPPSDDYAEFNSDLLVETRLGGGAFLTFDGAYYHYLGNNEPIEDEVSVLGAVATPKLGIGSLQPYCRWQWFSPRANSTDIKTFAVDGGLELPHRRLRAPHHGGVRAR